jgi:hypothetical protein
LAAVRTEARFPSIPADAGHYESFYLKAAAPAGGRAVWIRHTVHKRPGAAATGGVWLTVFDAGWERPRALKQQVGAEGISVPAGAYLRVGESEIAPARLDGELAVDGVEAGWSLRFRDHAGPLDHFPKPWMYERPLPRTKLRSPHPAITVDGRIELGGERLTLSEWPGMIGHNWGAEHAETWIWIHGATASGGERGYVDLGAGRVKLGPLTSPWVLNGEILHGGERLRVGGLHPLRRTRIAAEPGRCDLRIPAADGAVVRGSVSAPLDRFVGWTYADPAGPGHHSLNCSIADLDLTVERSGRPPLRVAVPGAATYELGTRRTDHGVPIEPFADG